ncbi:MAG: VTT domain-containing protein [Bryobacteraceae bacterium]
MHVLLRHLFAYLLHLGALGLVILGVLDSSFLFLPVGNDILLVVLVARHHALFPVYVLAAALGSAIGVLLLDVVCRKGGEEGLKKMMKPKRLNYLKKKMKEHGSIAVVTASLSPPPFPFTAVIGAASAFQFPRLRLIGLVFCARAIRFSLVGLAAIWLGRRIIRLADSSAFIWFMEGFIVLCLIGSTISIVRWVRYRY